MNKNVCPYVLKYLQTIHNDIHSVNIIYIKLYLFIACVAKKSYTFPKDVNTWEMLSLLLWHLAMTPFLYLAHIFHLASTSCFKVILN